VLIVCWALDIIFTKETKKNLKVFWITWTLYGHINVTTQIVKKRYCIFHLEWSSDVQKK
jgi:hypothetical protein